MIKTPLELIQGDSKCWAIQIRRNNQVIDISGWKIFFTAKTDYSVTDTNATIAVTIDVPNDINSQKGIAFLRLLSSDTDVDVGTYVYDIKYQSSEDRETIARGDLTIVPTITQRTT
jgi:hypothetical protein